MTKKLKRYLIVAAITTLVGAFILFGVPMIILRVSTIALDIKYDTSKTDNLENNSSEKNISDNNTSELEKDKQKEDKQKEEIAAREAAKSVGTILLSAPEELTSRSECLYEGPDSLWQYYGASKPIKVESDYKEFKKFADSFFMDHPYEIKYYYWGGDLTTIQCGDYNIERSVYFNPNTDSNGKLVCTIDGFEDGMSLTTNFAYDPSGKYVLWGYDPDPCVFAKFIGLQFTDENPYISPIQESLEKLALLEYTDYKGDISYYLDDSVVRVESTEDEFLEFCDAMLEGIDKERFPTGYNDEGEAKGIKCGDYILLRSQEFNPVKYGSHIYYVGEEAGDTEPIRSRFCYNTTGQFVLVSFEMDPNNIGDKFIHYSTLVETSEEE